MSNHSRNVGFALIASLCFLSTNIRCRDGGSVEVDTSDNKVIVVLLDRSGSVRGDRAIYDKALSVIRKSLREGDRFLMGSITSASGTDFATSIDYSLPAPLGEPGWMAEPVEYKKMKKTRQKQLNDILSNLDREIKVFLDKKSDTARTTIFESLSVVEPLFQSEVRKRKILVILSDMLEDSGVANFDRGRLSNETIREVIEHQQSIGTLPDLRDVKVYVAGAVASPPERAGSVKRFWLEYFAATGASMDRGQYARVLTSFAE